MQRSTTTMQERDVMKVIILYRYIRPDGGVSISPSIPDCEYTEMFRLIAEKGNVLTQNGVDTYPCKDVETTEGWYEIPEPVEFEDEVADMKASLNVLGVEA